MKNQVEARQGDLHFINTEASPSDASRWESPVLAFGEVTGHEHRIVSPSFDQMECNVDKEGHIYLLSRHTDIRISHDEHETITLPADRWFCMTRQREYDQLREEVRRVAD